MLVGTLDALSAQQIHKLLAGLGLVEGSAESTRSGNRVVFLHTAHLHAHVLGLHHHHHAQWAQCLLYAVLDLLCQAFLHLQPMAVDVDHPGYLAETGDVTIGDVGHMCLAVKGQDMVLAHREEVYVFHDDHLVIFLLKQGIGQHFVRILAVSPGEYLHGLGHAHGSFLQSLPSRILSQQCQYFAIMRCQGIESLAILCFCFHISVLNRDFSLDDGSRFVAHLAQLLQHPVCFLIVAVVSHPAYPAWGIEMDIDGLSGKLHLYLVSDTFRLLSVRTGVAACKGLHPVPVYLVAVAHHFLTHVHGRYLFCVFVLVGFYGLGLGRAVFLGRFGSLGLVRLGVCGGCRRFSPVGLRGVAGGYRLLVAAVYQIVDSLTLRYGHSAFARGSLPQLVHESLCVGSGRSGQHGDAYRDESSHL